MLEQLQVADKMYHQKRAQKQARKGHDNLPADAAG
jgi:hypothetical protein